MKLIPRPLRFLTSRRMRRLVWLPSTVVAFFFLGATMESNGFRLSLWREPVRQPVQTLRNLELPQHLAMNGQNVGASTLSQTARISPPSQSSALAYAPVANNTNAYGTPTNFSNPININQNQTSSAASISSPNNVYQSPPVYSPNNHRFGIVASPIPHGSPAVVYPQPAASPLPVPYAQPAYTQPVPHAQPALGQSDQLRALSNTIRLSEWTDPINLRESLSNLLDLAIQQFDEKQGQERTELSEAKERLATWEEAISKRDSLKKSLIESHLAQLLDSPDLMNWSFTGTQLLKSKPLHVNYPEIFRQLWAAKEKHELDETVHSEANSIELPKASQDEGPPHATLN